MGYDFVITGGTIQGGHEVQLVSDLAQLAVQLELPWFPVNTVISGYVDASSELDELFGTPFHKRFPNSQPIQRDWIPIEAAKIKGYKSDLQFEIIQGITICHPYEAWTILWNVSHRNAIAMYDALDGSLHERGECCLRPARVFAIAEIAEFLSQPTPLPYVASNEYRVGIHVPWRKSDVAAALDALKIVERHSHGFMVEDDYHVWEQGIDSWHNLTSGYTKAMKMKPVWPDAGDLLDSNPDTETDNLP